MAEPLSFTAKIYKTLSASRRTSLSPFEWFLQEVS